MKAIKKEIDKNPVLIDIENTPEAIEKALEGKANEYNIHNNLYAYCGSNSVLIVGQDREGNICDIDNLDEVLEMIEATRYIRENKEHNSWHCLHCWHQEQFEADGPYENGWNCCPHCGRMLLEPTEVQGK